MRDDDEIAKSDAFEVVFDAGEGRVLQGVLGYVSGGVRVVERAACHDFGGDVGCHRGGLGGLVSDWVTRGDVDLRLRGLLL